MGTSATRVRRRHVAALCAVAASILLMPFASSPAAAATWHYSPGIEGGMTFGPDGAFYFVDVANSQVDRLDPAGHVTVVAGVGPFVGDVNTKDHGWTQDTGYTGDGGPAVDAQLMFPFAIAFDAQGISISPIT
jgi:streptogramin lyase